MVFDGRFGFGFMAIEFYQRDDEEKRLQPGILWISASGFMGIAGWEEGHLEFACILCRMGIL